MAGPGTEIADRVLAACRAGAAEAAAALGRTLEGEFVLAPPESVEFYNSAAPPSGWNGPGLLFTFEGDGGSAALLLPTGAGLIPPWCAQPGESSRDRLLALAQELGASLLPEDFAPQRCEARWVEQLAAAAAECGVAEGAATASLPVSRGGQQSVLSLVWPFAQPKAPPSVERALEPSAAEASRTEPSSAPSAPEAAPKPGASARPRERFLYERIEEALPYLPVYSRSLLKIKVPVRVTLASTRLPIRQIVELAPGSLIQFPKSCEETLDLEISQRAVARGEAVKIGEKFGLRITHMVLPGERFVPLAPERGSCKDP